MVLFLFEIWMKENGENQRHAIQILNFSVFSALCFLSISILSHFNTWPYLGMTNKRVPINIILTLTKNTYLNRILIEYEYYPNYLSMDENEDGYEIIPVHISIFIILHFCFIFKLAV